VIPRVVATDLDGTLLRNDGTVSPRTLRVLRQAEEAGVEVFMVTARPPRFADALSSATGLRGTAVCSNGALVYDVGQRTVLTSRHLQIAAARQVADGLSAVVRGVGFAVETGHGVFSAPGFRAPFPRGRGSSAHGYLARRPLVAGYPVRQAARLVRGSRCANPLRVTKARALAAVCAERGVGAGEVVAFGDMPNDLEVLRWAGRGHAMENAHPSLLAAVPHRTLSNEQDGVAAVAERLLDAA
jgi:hydroxymethylpyrimidine pyrophosphatase-like HAD family hydrolase